MIKKKKSITEFKLILWKLVLLFKIFPGFSNKMKGIIISLLWKWWLQYVYFSNISKIWNGPNFIFSWRKKGITRQKIDPKKKKQYKQNVRIFSASFMMFLKMFQNSSNQLKTLGPGWFLNYLKTWIWFSLLKDMNISSCCEVGYCEDYCLFNYD